MCLVCSAMKHDVVTHVEIEEALDVARILERVASVSARPRYTMLILELLAKLARGKGRAGPWVEEGGALVPVREWLCEALIPMASRYAKRLALVEEIRSGLSAAGKLPDDPVKAAQAIDYAVRERVRASGMTSVSRAVTELVKAGLITRHYQGYSVDHENRGAQRHAVYTVPASVRCALGGQASLL